MGGRPVRGDCRVAIMPAGVPPARAGRAGQAGGQAVTTHEAGATDSGAAVGSSAAAEAWPPIDPWARADDLLACLDAGLRASHNVLDEARDAPAAGPRRLAAVLFDNRRHPHPGSDRAVGVELPRLRFRAAGAAARPRARRRRKRRPAPPARATHGRAGGGGTGPGRRRRARGPGRGRGGRPGAFILDGLVSGRHRLEIVVADATVEIPALEI